MEGEKNKHKQYKRKEDLTTVDGLLMDVPSKDLMAKITTRVFTNRLEIENIAKEIEGAIKEWCLDSRLVHPEIKPIIITDWPQKYNKYTQTSSREMFVTIDMALVLRKEYKRAFKYQPELSAEMESLWSAVNQISSKYTQA